MHAGGTSAQPVRVISGVALTSFVRASLNQLRPFSKLFSTLLIFVVMIL